MMTIGKDDRGEEKAGECYDWSELPEELLPLIDQRVIKLKHSIRLRSVCKTWRETLAEIQPILFRQSSSSPLLLLPYDDGGCGSRGCRLFLDVAHDQFHHIDFPKGFERITSRGSAFGWLFMLQLPVPVLLNPLTGDQIALPPITTIPNILEYDAGRMGHEYLVQLPEGKIRAGTNYMESIYMERMAMSADPEDDGCCIVMTIRNLGRRLAFCKLGDRHWTLIPNIPDGGPGSWLTNIVFWRDQFYALDQRGRVLCCDLGDIDDPKMSYLTSDIDVRSDMCYLLVGPADELMMVTRSIDFESRGNADEDEEEDDDDKVDYEEDVGDEENEVDDHDVRGGDDDDGEELQNQDDVVYLTDLDSDGEVERCGAKKYWLTDFKVYRLNKIIYQWDIIHGIGDYALFLGANTPICLPTKDYSRLKSNCIYFLDDYFDGHRRRRLGGHDMSIYHMEDGRVEPLLPTDLYKPFLVWPPPVWI